MVDGPLGVRHLSQGVRQIVVPLGVIVDRRQSAAFPDQLIERAEGRRIVGEAALYRLRRQAQVFAQ